MKKRGDVFDAVPDDQQEKTTSPQVARNRIDEIFLAYLLATGGDCLIKS
jgi:hypothetical protein